MVRTTRATRAGLVGWMLAASVGALASPARAAAPPPRVRLQWASPDERCLSAGALRQAVERTLGREVFADEPGLAEVRGQIEPAGAGFRARIELRQAGQPTLQRTLSTGKVCRRLDESIAVVVALMIDTVLAPAEPVQMAVPDEPPVAEAPPAAATLPAVVPVAEPALTTGFALAGGVGRGVLPGWAPEAGLVAIMRPSLALGAEADLRWLGEKQTLHRDSLGGNFTAWLATLRACVSPPGLPIRLRYTACAGGGTGRLTGSGVGLDARESPAGTLLFAALTPARLAFRLVPHVWLSADASVRLMLRREQFGFLDRAGSFVSLHQPSLLAPTLSVMISLESAPFLP